MSTRANWGYQAGKADRVPDAVTLAEAPADLYPVAAILTIAMLAGVYGYINTEEYRAENDPPFQRQWKVLRRLPTLG